MSETLTYDPGTDTVTTEDNLTPEEQDSLKVGEEMDAQQEQLLAGKYKNAEDLEQAYVELQKKLGNNSEEKEEADEVEEEADTEDNQSVDKSILDTLWDEASNGEKFTDTTLEQLGKMNASEVAQMHLQYRADQAKVQPQTSFTEEDVTNLQNVAGGERGYNDMLQWANSNLNEQEINMFDTIMERGDSLSAFFAVNSLATRYKDAVGYEGKMLTGNAPKQSNSIFRSQAEVVKAMSDPRYETDSAYRQDIADKLERSNINF